MIAEKLAEYGGITCGHFFPAAGDTAWKNISQADLDEIREMHERLHAAPYPMRTLTGFLAFVETGSRSRDEKPYFLRREKLCAAVLAVCTGDEDAMGDVLDGIWCICEESSWVVSAHNINPIPGAPRPEDMPLPDVNAPYVDLFAAQTGMILALTLDLLSVRLDAVSPLIGQRIRSEIDTCIFRPFMQQDDFWWMGNIRKDLCNWTPWILSNILMAAYVQMDDMARLEALLRRSAGMLDRWLDVMPADGGCDEGAGYWNMAGGSLLDCIEIYEKAFGVPGLFRNESKIRNILSFPVRAEIGNGWFLNFADCDARPFLSGERIEAAGVYLDDRELTALGRRLRGRLADELSDVPHFSRLLNKLFNPSKSQATTSGKADVWLPDLEVRIVRRAGVTLAVKGGHNGENHNHNDVGSFMLYIDDEPVIVDAGNMTYTAKTFSDERYTLWNVRSAYHNLPIAGTCEQSPGRAYAARRVRALPNGISLGLEGAYDCASGLEMLTREAVLSGDGTLTLRDTLRMNRPEPVTWVFMFREEPVLDGSRIRTGKMRMQIPAEAGVCIECIPVEDPRMQKSFPGNLYRVLIRVEAAGQADVEFIVRRNDTYE